MNQKLITILITFAVLFTFYILFPQTTQLKQGPPLGSAMVGNIEKMAVAGKCDEALPEVTILANKNLDNEDIWHWKGVCEFELKDFTNAKLSFQKVISINPESKTPSHNASQNYLDILGDEQFNQTIATSSLSQEEFESIIKVDIDHDIFTFVNANSIPSNEYISFVTADYTSNTTPEEVLIYFNDVLEEDFQIETDEFDNSAPSEITDDPIVDSLPEDFIRTTNINSSILISGTNDKTILSATIWKRTPTLISIIYIVSK